MNWEQKLAACKALRPYGTGLRMRSPGDWYVEQIGLEVIEEGHRGMLVGRYGNGATPEAAVEDHWAKLTASDVAAVVLNAMGPDRREVRWNGFMWEDLPTPSQPGGSA